MIERDPGAGALVDPEQFRDVIGRFATGVTVVTTALDGRPLGTTASAVSSLSLEPPMVLVCLDRGSDTGRAIVRAGTLAVNVLHVGQDKIARAFARKGEDKFAGVEFALGVYGDPLLLGALAQIECRVVEEARGGTHTIFISEVAAASGVEGMPLAYYRGKFGRFHAPEADRR